MILWIYITLLVAVAIFCITKVIFRQKAVFIDKFPPISDAEFLARCEPGTDPEIALKVRRMVSKFFAIEYERIYPSSRFVDDFAVS